jgi:PAS domain S-box-containing protein
MSSSTPPEDILGQVQPFSELLPVGIWICDQSGAIVGHNRRAVELWGRAPRIGELVDTLLPALGGARPTMSGVLSRSASSNRQSSGDPACDVEILHRHGDGSKTVALQVSAHPLTNRAGAAIAMVICFEDITETRRVRAKPQTTAPDVKRGEETSKYLAAIVASSNDAIVSKDLNGIITSWNQGAERLFGYSAEEVVGKSITILIPPDRLDEENEILRRIRSGERVLPYDTVRRRKDGSLVKISLTVSPVRNAKGVITGASKIARDVTEERQAAERQAVLAREMSHRAKNMLALAGSVVTLSARFAQTPKEMVEAVRGRLAALAKAHDLTLPDPARCLESAARRISLHEMLQTIVRPFVDGREGHERIAINGPEVWIGGGALTSVALLLHEFSTNAAKYGALSVPSGQVEVRWSTSLDELHLIWRERGSPPTDDSKTRTKGFGSHLTDITVRGHLAGSMTREWNPEGLTVRVTMPLSRIEN